MLLVSFKRILDADITRKSLHTIATKVGLMGADFIINVLITRVLGPEGRGLVALAGASSGVVCQVGLLGLHNANCHFAAKPGYPLHVLLASSTLLSATVGLAVVVMVGVLNQLAPSLLPVQGILLLLILIGAPFQMLEIQLNSLLLGMQRVYEANHLELFVRTTLLLSLSALLLTDRVTAETVYGMVIFFAIAGAGLLLFQVRKQVRQRLSLSMLRLRELLQYGLKSYLAAMLSFLVLRLDLFLIAYMLGTASAGHYAAALAILNALYVIPVSLSQMTFAKLSAMSKWSDKVRLTKQVTLGSAVLMVPILGIAAITADWFFPLIFGGAFEPSAEPFVYLLPGIFVWSLESVVRKLYTSDGYASWVVWAWAVALAINLVLNLVLIPRVGLVGAAIASSIALAVVGFWTCAMYLRDPRQRSTDGGAKA